jgi:hypothetical protein
MVACIGDRQTTPEILESLSHVKDFYNLVWRPGDDIIMTPEGADHLPKLSNGFESCVGWLVAAKDKKTGQEISVMGHQLTGEMGAEKASRISARMDLFLEKIDRNTLEVVIFAGDYTPPLTPQEHAASFVGSFNEPPEVVQHLTKWFDSMSPEARAGMDAGYKLMNDSYIGAVNSLGKLFRSKVGKDPLVISGPSMLSGNTAACYMTSTQGVPRRLFIIRAHSPIRSGVDTAFPASDALRRKAARLRKRLDTLPAN